jgi:hypothetical protein
MEEKYIPEVGDKVRLLVSEDNFNSEMELIVKNNPIVTITEVIQDGTYNPPIKIRFKNSGKWGWTLENKHFEPIITPIKPNKSHNKALIKLIKYSIT